MQIPVKDVTRLMTRRSRSGQSIILIAFAFIALIAFVGIATDVAMLFVRFSTLRRAVDAAAIAAAGQIREDVNFMILNSAAKQFIQIHGIDPNNVMVETCDTEIVAYIKKYPGTLAKDALSALIAGSPPSELCKRNPQKLIRVTAQVESPTAFLAIIGWRTVTLQTSSVAQTAVLDVAIVLDTSLSEMQDTYNHQGAKDAAGKYIYPCRVTDAGPNFGLLDPTCSGSSGYGDNSEALKDYKDFTNTSPRWNGSGMDRDPANTDGVALDPYGSGTARAIRDECWMNPSPDFPQTASNYAWAGCCNDPTTQADDVDKSKDPVTQKDQYYVTGYFSDHDATGGFGTLNPHQVLKSDGVTPGDNAVLHSIGLPGQGILKGYNPDPNWYLFDDESLANGSVIITEGKQPMSGKPAAYVKSAQPDGNKSDLICRPFKDVRDAARRFIKRLDFVRGDRIILVTFDSGARAIQPYESSVPIITDKKTAVTTLNMQVGVEVSPVPIQGSATCQSYNTVSSQYTKFKTPGEYPEMPTVPGSGVTPGRYEAKDYYMDANGGLQPINDGKNLASYWTISQCPDTNTGGGIQAANNALVNPNWIRRESVWVMIVLSDGYPNRTPPVGSAGIMSEVRDSLQVKNASSTDADYNMPSDLDYNNLDQAQKDRIAKFCNLLQTPTAMPPSFVPTAGPTPTFPYNTDYGKQPQWCITNNQVDASAQPYRYPAYAWGLTTVSSGEDKGSFGFCPWWTFCDLHPESPPAGKEPYDKLTQCIENNAPGIWATGVQEPHLPYCTDNDPNARHSCMDGTGRINPKNSDTPNPANYYCDPHYDATDYARDRADFAGLINYMDKSSDGKVKKGNFIAIYSIFFDHASSGNKLGENILGVKFLRYLADVGDNGLVDNHLQRWYRDVRDGVITLTNPSTGTNYAAWVNPPMGRDEKAPTGAVVLPGGPGDSAKVSPANGQPVPPTYDGSAALWAASPYKYGNEDSCAKYDYMEVIDPGTGLNPIPGSPVYESSAKRDCGQYFYANDPSHVTSAFIEIAGRLFTRLSR